MSWKTKKLDEVCEIQYGTRVVNKKHGGSVYPVYGGGGATFSMDSFNRENRMVIARFAISEQCTRFVKGKFFLNDSGLTVAPKNENELSQDFIDLQLFSLNEKIYSLARGSAQKNLDVPAFREMEIVYPESIQEQRRIVKNLRTTLEVIEEARLDAERNLQNARDLFDSCLENLFINTKTGWVPKTLSQVCNINATLIDPREKKYLNLLHIGAGNIETKTGRLFNLQTAEKEGLISGKFLFDSSVVLYSKIRPYLMKVARPDFDGLCSADIYPLTPNKEFLSRDYLFYLLLSRAFTEYAIEGSARTGMPKVNREHLFAYRFLLPPLSEQKSITKKLDHLSPEIKELEIIYKQKLTALADLQRTTLKRAFSVEILPPKVSAKFPQTVPAEIAVPSPYIRNQIHAAIIDQAERDGGSTTEVAVAKYDHLLQEVFGLSLGYQFQAQQFGPFDAQIKRLISSGLGRNRWFTKRNGMIVFGTNIRGLLFRQSGLYRNAQAIMRELSQLGVTRMNAESIELLSTVCHSIKEKQSVILADVRANMSNWQTDGGRTKAEKFTEDRTQKCIDFVLKNHLERRLLTTI